MRNRLINCLTVGMLVAAVGLTGCGTPQQNTTDTTTQESVLEEAEAESEETVETETSEETGSAALSDSSKAGSGDIPDDLDTLSAYYLSFGVYDWEDANYDEDNVEFLEEAGEEIGGKVTIFSFAVVGEQYEDGINYTAAHLDGIYVYREREKLPASQICYNSETYSDFRTGNDSEYVRTGQIVSIAVPGEWEMSDFSAYVKFGITEVEDERILGIGTDRIGDFSDFSETSIVTLKGVHYLVLESGSKSGSGYSTYEDWDAYYINREYQFRPLEGSLVSDVTDDDLLVECTADLNLYTYGDRYLYVCHADTSDALLTITGTYFCVYTQEEKDNGTQDLIEDEWEDNDISQFYEISIDNGDGTSTTLENSFGLNG